MNNNFFFSSKIGNIYIQTVEDKVKTVTIHTDPIQINALATLYSPNNNHLIAQSINKYLNYDSLNINVDFEIDDKKTPYQKLVLEYLNQIPIGHTKSYGEIAQILFNSKKYARVVANGCASNNLAILIACHRVIKADKTLSGYRWGVEAKQYLLKLEQYYAKHKP